MSNETPPRNSSMIEEEAEFRSRLIAEIAVLNETMLGIQRHLYDISHQLHMSRQ